MKKSLLLLLTAGYVFAANAQSQRLPLVEEFTNASCPPCAASNPAFNHLLNQNSSKVVSIKYQTVWPGADPMNAQNQSQVATRVSYYAVTGVPDVEFDGGIAFSATPPGFSQSHINNRYNVASPFTIDVDFHLSPASDSIYCHARIKCTQAATGALVAHMAVVERNIYFTNPPGTNGEKQFESVMKRMLPDASGTPLAATWAVGDSMDLNYSWKMNSSPTVIYNPAQLSCVVFIQNNTTKEVLQAGYAAPNISDDAGVEAIMHPVFQCSADLNVDIRVKNHSLTTPLSSFDIVYTVDNGTPQTVNVMNSSLAPGQDSLISYMITGLAPGTHNISVKTLNPNGVTDQESHNDSYSRAVTIFGTPVALPVSQNFVSTGFPTGGMLVENTNDDEYTWERYTTGHTTPGAAKLNYYWADSASVDNLILPQFDFTQATPGTNLVFHVAYSGYNATHPDQLNVKASTDCGQTWVQIYSKQGAGLATTGYTTAEFVPTSSQWRVETVSLDQFIGAQDLILEFNAVSRYGNIIYIDDINVHDAILAVPQVDLNNSIELYPNPATSEAFISFALPKVQDVKVSIVNSLGAVVSVKNYSSVSNSVEKLDISSLAKGTYSVTIQGEGQLITRRLNISE